MDLNKIEEIIERIRKKPLKTSILIISSILIFCISTYLSSYLAERAKPTVPNPTITNFGMPIDVNPIITYADVTDSIIVYIRSERFGKKIQFKFPKDMKIWAAKKMIIAALNLPDNIEIPELGINIKFDYILSIDSSGSLNDNNTIIKAGIQNESALKLNATILIVDPELEYRIKERLERKETKNNERWMQYEIMPNYVVDDCKISLRNEIHQFLKKKYSELESPFEFDSNVGEEIYQFLKNKYLDLENRSESDPNEQGEYYLRKKKEVCLEYVRRFQKYDNEKLNFTK